MDKYLIKKSIFQIFNGFRIVAFWIFASLLFLSVIAAVRESKVKVTVEDAVLGYKINEYGIGTRIQEFDCVVNGRKIVVYDTNGRKTGDNVQLIFRDGEYYSLVDPENPEIGVSMKERISYRFTMATGGNLFFTVIAYVFFFLLTIKSRKEHRKEYPVLFIVTHICGILSVFLFWIYCYWLDFLNLIFYAVIFAIIWIVRVIAHNIKLKNL